jgi:hypothetical protein
MGSGYDRRPSGNASTHGQRDFAESFFAKIATRIKALRRKGGLQLRDITVIHGHHHSI